MPTLPNLEDEEIDYSYSDTEDDATLENVLNNNALVLTDLLNSLTNIHQSPSLGIDTFSGLNVRSRPITTLTNKKMYDSLFLVDFLLEKRDLRDPISGKSLTTEDLDLLSESLVDVELKQRIKDIKCDQNLPSSVTTSVTQFCEDSLHVSTMHLLAACELTEITSMSDLQAIFDDLNSYMIRCFGVLIQVQPLIASKYAISISNTFTTAISEISNNNYIYEATAILPIAASIRALCSTIIDCIINQTLSNSLLKLENVKSIRIVF